jgi:diketogulonate reductase-like aldo/keto reductase
MSSRIVRGVTVPAFLYGTAWKEDRTEELTRAALEAGFRGIDTANQRRHYVEAGAGGALKSLIAEGRIDRSAVFLQTKFTHRAGQDHRLPYDPAAAPEEQVRQSFESSLSHLHTDHLDSYVLHGPSTRRGIAAADWSVWRAMEALQRGGRVALLGVSNVTLEQLASLDRDAEVKPAFVQNRCYASAGWDRDVRAFCNEHGVVYQGFSLLTANRAAVESSVVRRIAQRIGRSPEQVVFRFALQVGMIPLTGTSSSVHMKQDLECLEFELGEADITAVEHVAN